MNGSAVLTEEEKQEIPRDAQNVKRRGTFLAARLKSQEGTIDEYVHFLSENIGWIEFTPSVKVTTDFKL